MSTASEIAKIIAKNIARRAATKKIPAKDAREVARQARQNPSGSPRRGIMPRTDVVKEKKASGALSVKRPMNRNTSKPDTRITRKTALSKDRIQNRSERYRTGPIESGMLSPRGLNRPLGSSRKPQEKIDYPNMTPAQRERAAAMLKASSKRMRQERVKFEKTSIAKRKERAGKPLSGKPRPSRDKSLPSMDSRKATTDKPLEQEPRYKAVVTRSNGKKAKLRRNDAAFEIMKKRKVGKRDYSRGEVNTLAQSTVQRQADRIVNKALKDRKVRRIVKAEEEALYQALKKKGK